MKRVGVIYGMENSFPFALIEEINARKGAGVQAESILLGGVRMAEPRGYDVIVDRISHDIPFYRAYLKNAALTGTTVINNPFWWSADDKFFNYALAAKLGVAVPPTVLLPHKEHPPGTTDRSMRNLMYPLNWDEIFDYVGFPAFLKPHDGGGWKHVYKVDSPGGVLRRLRSRRGDLCMTLQRGGRLSGVLPLLRRRAGRRCTSCAYDPRAPHDALRARNPPTYDARLLATRRAAMR